LSWFVCSDEWNNYLVKLFVQNFEVEKMWKVTLNVTFIY
jgi:hypothetical protein